MENNKNIVWAIVLSVIVFVGWSLVENYRVNQDFWNFDRKKPVAQTATVQSNESSGGEVVKDGGVSSPALEGKIGNAKNLNLPRNELIAQEVSQNKRIAVKNNRIQGSINLVGGKIDDITFQEYHETYDETSALVNFLDPATGQKPFFVDLGWTVDPSLKTRVTFPDGDSIWQSSGGELTPDHPILLSWKSPEGVIFKKEIALDNDFMFKVTQTIEDNGLFGDDFKDKISTYARVVRVGTPKDMAKLYILHEGLVGYLDDSLHELKYDKIIKEGERSKNYNSTGGWIGITDKYWLAAIVPNQTIPFQSRMLSQPQNVAMADDIHQNIYQTDVTLPVQKDGQITHIFIGAKQTTLLDKYSKDLNVKSFDLAVDFGIFYFLTKPIYFALHWLNSMIGNFGVAILILTIFIKALLFPLANKSYTSMSKMKLLQPKMLELKEKFGEDKMKLNQSMMQLYKDEKVNPLSGCLPILVQIPIFFSLYKVLYVTIEMRHAPFFGWIHDLSSPDPLRILNLFGLFPWEVPAILAMVNIGIWPILMGITMWAQMKLNPTPADPIQQKIFSFMPIIFTFMLANFAAGLVIYWTWNNLLSITQQYIIMRRMGVEIGWHKAKTGDKGK